MRAVVYVVAALAAAGIMVAIVMMPSQDQAETPAAAGTAAPATPASAEAGKLVLKVPDMHCPVMCYPKVKKTLESDTAVTGVELTEQKQEGVIDNPAVVVKYKSGFDVDAAIAALAEEDFRNSQVVP